MSALVPVATPESDGWLARHLAPGRRCWLLRRDSAADAPVEAALAELAGGSGGEVAWVAALTGAADEVDYALEVAAADCAGKESALGAGGARQRVLCGGAVLAASLLDTAAARPALGLVLTRVSGGGVETAAQALSAGCPKAAVAAGQLTLLRPGGGSGVVLLVADEEPVDRLAARLGARLGAAAEPPPARIDKRRQRTGPRSLPPAAAAAVAAVVAAGMLTAVWRSAPPVAPAAGPLQAAAPAAPAVPAGIATVARPQVPAPQFGAALAYDPGHRQAVLFGGVGQYDQTWTWDGRRWSRARPGQSPPERFGAAAAADPLNGRVLLFGGRARQGAVLDDTWSWDGASWDPVDTGPGPPPDVAPAMTADPLRRSLVLVTRDPAGGTQTWTWEGNRWARLATPTAPPSPGPMGFDPASGTVLLAVGGDPRAATWSWDGRSWRALHPPHAPAGSFASALVLDPASNRPLLLTSAVSRVGEPTVAAATTWMWSGSDWVEQHPGGIPEVVVGAVSDAVDGAVVAFGRATQAGDDLLRDAWAWTGRTWARLGHAIPAGAPLPRRPPSRVGSLTAYDEPRHQLVLFGGEATSAPGGSLSDTWTWDGYRWTARPDAGGPLRGLAMAYDPRGARVMLVADTAAAGPLPSRPQTWVWNGVVWQRAAVAAELPEGTVVEAMTADRSRGVMLAVTRCCVAADGSPPGPPRHLTWTFDGSRWQLRQPPTSPAGDALLGLVFDPVRAAPVATLSDESDVPEATTWAWDGSSWTRLHPATPALVDPSTFAMSADPSTGAIVAVERNFAPPATLEVTDRVLSWDGHDWSSPPSAALPDLDISAASAALFFDTELGRLVIVGAQGFDSDDAWMWTGTTWLRLATEGAG